MKGITVTIRCRDETQKDRIRNTLVSRARAAGLKVPDLIESLLGLAPKKRKKKHPE